MLICNARIYNHTERRFFDGNILIKNGIICKIGEFEISDTDRADMLDAKGRCVVPAFIDVHTHGRAGYDFTLKNADLSVMARDYAKHGVATVMPAIASAPFGEMLASIERINSYNAGGDEASFCGIHVEGRWLNPDKKGAHAPEMLSALDPAELDEDTFASCKALHISAAFELDKNGEFAKKALSMGATLGLAHTAATYAEAKSAETNGVTCYTHLFNAMPPLHHRDGGAVCAAFDGNAFAELICDGIHVSPEMVRLAYRNLGSDRLILISDSMEATGMPDGEYSIAGNPATVKNGIARTPSGALAGSTLTLDTALKNLMRFANISLADALPCLTVNPAKAVGIFDTVGSISEGKRADLIILDDEQNANVREVILRGNPLKSGGTICA